MESDDTYSIDLGDLDALQDTYSWMREQGPVVRASLDMGGGQQRPFAGLFVTRYDEVIATLLDDRFSSDFYATMSPEQLAMLPPVAAELRPIVRSIISVDPPDHTRLRKLVQPSFTARAMEALRPRIQRIADALLDTAEREAAERGERAPDRHMDLIAAFAYPLPVTVITDMLGIPHEDRARVRGWTENLFEVDRRQGGLMDEETRAKLQELITYLRGLFHAKKAQPTDDLISQLVQAEEDGDKLTEDELVSMVFILYIAGHVTTVNLLGNGVFALLSHPDQLARLKSDPALAKGVVEETLRYWGPIDVIARRIAKQDFELFGTPIRRGEVAMVGLASANRDPRRFPDPDTYDITRADAERNVAFGKGIHVCLGAPLARTEGQVAFETLFRRFPELRLAVPVEDVHWGKSFIRGLAHLPVLF
ncbi:MAG: cytochrome P450 [Myxococcaceae bacterium]|nr:cytochrome P450 [Myxococcaceae bacterium]MCI0670172.1 cytochrome P450 [Myxococcaceae bacterium]